MCYRQRAGLESQSAEKPAVPLLPERPVLPGRWHVLPDQVTRCVSAAVLAPLCLGMCVRGALLTLERKTERLTSLTWPLLLSVSGQAPLLQMCGLLNELGRPSEISLLQKVVLLLKIIYFSGSQILVCRWMWIHGKVLVLTIGKCEGKKEKMVLLFHKAMFISIYY